MRLLLALVILPLGVATANATQPLRPCAMTPNVGDVLVWNGQDYCFQPKPYLDIRDIPGVDCDGTSDSSVALNGKTAVADAVSHRRVSSAGCRYLRLDHQWLIYAQTGFELDLTGTTIFGCNGEPGAVIRVNRSGHTFIHGVGATIETKSYLCGHASAFTTSIQYTNPGSGGYTSTHNTLADVFLTSDENGYATPGYVGYHLHGTPNQENFRIERVKVLCQGSPGSYGFWSDDENADSTTWEGGGFNGCYRMIQMEAGRLRLLHTNNSYNGTYSSFGAGGASIAQSTIGCVTEIVENVFAEGSGTLIRSGTRTSFPCDNYLRGNQASPQDIDPAGHFIELGYQVGTLSFENNMFVSGEAVAILDDAIVGSAAPNSPYAGGQVQVLDKGGNRLTDVRGHTYKLSGLSTQ